MRIKWDVRHLLCGSRIAACLAACEGMGNPVEDVKAMRKALYDIRELAYGTLMELGERGSDADSSLMLIHQIAHIELAKENK